MDLTKCYRAKYNLSICTATRTAAISLPSISFWISLNNKHKDTLADTFVS